MSFRIVFYGTPDFAVATLQALVENQYNILAVVTAPDKPAGRGFQMQSSEVKKFAEKNNIPVLQPINLKSTEFFEVLKKLNPDLQIVVAFRMLPQHIWSFPQYGTFNLHASLLPQYRGAAPIHWAVIHGEKITGVTTFFLNEKIDEGNIILQKEVVITENETTGDVYIKLMNVGAGLVIETLKKFETGDFSSIKQDFSLQNFKLAPKLTKENTKILWNSSSQDIYNFVRGLNPYPVAWTVLKNNSEQISCKIYSVTFEKQHHNVPFGKIITDNKKYLKVSCLDGYVYINELQLQAKKRMKTEDFLRGFLFTDSFSFI